MRSIKKRLKLFFTRPEEIFVVITLTFGLASVFMMPLLSVNDEGAHYQRSYELMTGQIKNTGCSFPKEVASDVVNGDNIATLIDQQRTSVSYFDQPINPDGSSILRNQSCGSASSYSPIMHLPQAIGVTIANAIYPSTGSMIIGGRIANLLFYVVSLYFVIKYVRVGKWVFMTVAMIPMIIHLAASLSADVMNSVFVFTYIAAMFSAFASKGRLGKKHLLILFISAVMMPVTKMPNVILLFPLLFLSPKLFPSNPKRFQSLPFSFYKYMLGIGIALTGFTLLMAWQHTYNGSLVTTAPNNPLVSNPWHFATILFNTYFNAGIGYADILFRGTTGIFSFKFSYPTYVIVLTWVTLLFGLFLHDKKEEAKMKGTAGYLSILVTITGLLFVLAVTYALYTAWAIQPYRLGPGAAYADGVQGRYFTILLTLLIPIGIFLRRFVSIVVSHAELVGVILFTSISFQMLFYLYQLYAMTH